MHNRPQIHFIRTVRQHDIKLVLQINNYLKNINLRYSCKNYIYIIAGIDINSERYTQWQNYKFPHHHHPAKYQIGSPGKKQLILYKKGNL